MAYHTQQVMGPVERIMYFSGQVVIRQRESNYEIWETKFLSHLNILGLKGAILVKNLNGNKTNSERNNEVKTKLRQFLDDTILFIIMWES